METGWQLVEGQGDANVISIRGLPDPATTWNGRNIFTANGRTLQLQDIPANLVSRIDVFKTRSAEQLETGLAGQIDECDIKVPAGGEGSQDPMRPSITVVSRDDEITRTYELQHQRNG